MMVAREREKSSELGSWFDPWLTSCGSILHPIALSAAEYHLNASTRLRRPKADQVERVRTITSAVIANLALSFFESANHLVALPMMHKTATRYERPGFYQMPEVVASMEASGFIRKHVGKRRVKVTTVEPDGVLLAALSTSTCILAEIGRTEGGESIILTARTGRDGRGRDQPAAFIDYLETAETVALREALDEINVFLKAQLIELDGVKRADFSLNRRFLLREPEAMPTFDLHGRMYGAFWITLPKRQRAALRINGESIADLDFASMFPRLAYAHLGFAPPQGDLYAIPGLEGHRKGVKAGVSALLSTRGKMVRLPREVKDALPAGWTAGRFIAAVEAKHPVLMPLFGRDFAMDLMFTESQIMITALHDLMSQGIPALPIHDGAMVPASRVREAKEAMERASVKVAGVQLQVTETELL